VKCRRLRLIVLRSILRRMTDHMWLVVELLSNLIHEGLQNAAELAAGIVCPCKCSVFDDSS
jgi:hypothetical protein